MLYFQSLLYIPEIICIELINQHHNKLLASHLKIQKTQELVIQKYYWPTFYHNVEAYVKGYDIYLASKTLRYKPYRDSYLYITKKTYQ